MGNPKFRIHLERVTLGSINRKAGIYLAWFIIRHIKGVLNEILHSTYPRTKIPVIGLKRPIFKILFAKPLYLL